MNHHVFFPFSKKKHFILNFLDLSFSIIPNQIIIIWICSLLRESCVCVRVSITRELLPLFLFFFMTRHVFLSLVYFSSPPPSLPGKKYSLLIIILWKVTKQTGWGSKNKIKFPFPFFLKFVTGPFTRETWVHNERGNKSCYWAFIISLFKRKIR